MKPADRATVQRMYECIAPTAAAEMKSRVLAKLREMSNRYGLYTADDRNMLREAMIEIEMLPLSKEAT